MQFAVCWLTITIFGVLSIFLQTFPSSTRGGFYPQRPRGQGAVPGVLPFSPSALVLIFMARRVQQIHWLATFIGILLHGGKSFGMYLNENKVSRRESCLWAVWTGNGYIKFNIIRTDKIHHSSISRTPVDVTSRRSPRDQPATTPRGDFSPLVSQ